MKYEKIQFQFYTKPDCPLCDEAKAELQSIAAKSRYLFEFIEIDITKDLGMFTRYKHLIPVLEMNGKRFFVHRIDRRKFLWQLRWYRFRRYFMRK